MHVRLSGSVAILLFETLEQSHEFANLRRVGYMYSRVEGCQVGPRALLQAYVITRCGPGRM